MNHLPQVGEGPAKGSRVPTVYTTSSRGCNLHFDTHIALVAQVHPVAQLQRSQAHDKLRDTVCWRVSQEWHRLDEVAVQVHVHIATNAGGKLAQNVLVIEDLQSQ